MGPHVQPSVETAGPDDFTVFVVLIGTLFFVVFMLSLPMWLSSFVRSVFG